VQVQVQVQGHDFVMGLNTCTLWKHRVFPQDALLKWALLVALVFSPSQPLTLEFAIILNVR
jgi:hypothetical protein